jgi:uncharacterized cupin superfamily protein
MTETTVGDGYAVSSLEALGEGPGFRKIRKELGVSAFGVNALVLPPAFAAQPHFHERQEELYFVHQGTVELTFHQDDDQRITLGPGGLARVDAATVRQLRNTSDSEEAVIVVAGGADGYVGRDGRRPEGYEELTRPG